MAGISGGDIMNNKGINKIVAGIIIAIVLIGAFLVPLALVLIDTGELAATDGYPFNIILGPSQGSLAARFELNQSIEVESLRLRLHHFKNLDPSATSFSVSPRITNAGSNSRAPALVSFPTILFTATDGEVFYTEFALNVRTLPPGSYLLAVDVFVNNGIAHRVMWRRGIENVGEAGIVALGAFRDDTGTGVWISDTREPPILANMILSGEISEPITPNNITENGDAGLIDTISPPPPPPPDTAQATTMIIIGLIFLIVGVFFIGLGRSNVGLVIIGVILLIVGLVILASASFILFALAIPRRHHGNLKQRRNWQKS